ncbi:MAG: HAD family hydrolase [Dehalococcoidia bacterium]|nr:HAD family hydrolase [Dehalococcoidia bacterium]
MPPRGPYRVSHVFLDVDGTLVDFLASLRAGLEAASTLMSERARALITPRHIEMERDRIVQAGGLGLRLAEMRSEAIRRVLIAHGVTDPAVPEEVTRHFFAARNAALQPYEDVLEPLEELRRRGFVTVAATNGNASLMETPVFAHLDVTFSAEEAGVSKPDVRFFHAAMAKVGGRPETSVMVGDRIDNDVAPAVAAGMAGILLDRAGNVSDSGVHAIKSLRELPGLLERV